LDVKPDYREHGLWQLSWISNMDKHRLVHASPVLGSTEAQYSTTPAEMFFPRNNDAGAIEKIELFEPILGRRHKTVARVTVNPTGPDPQLTITGFNAGFLVTELGLDLLAIGAIEITVYRILSWISPAFGTWVRIPTEP
jgi:hypothetical protein